MNNTLIGGECCRAQDTFQLCTGSLKNITQLECTNATSGASFSEGVITLKVPDSTIKYTSVRHAYANYPQCALYNKYDLPSGPFVLALDKAVAPALMEISSPVTGVNPIPGVALTPPMGVNSWNAFHCNVDERKMRSMADALVKLGLKDAGYEFVNIDDCWQVARSQTPDGLFNGTINTDPARFPGGIKSLADYIHSLGLKFGVYTAQKELTCQRRPGSWQHEALDVQSYCDWGVDYLKVDQCAGAYIFIYKMYIHVVTL